MRVHALFPSVPPPPPPEGGLTNVKWKHKFCYRQPIRFTSPFNMNCHFTSRQDWSGSCNDRVISIPLNSSCHTINPCSGLDACHSTPTRLHFFYNSKNGLSRGPSLVYTKERNLDPNPTIYENSTPKHTYTQKISQFCDLACSTSKAVVLFINQIYT